jgi:hypothetical protein
VEELHIDPIMPGDSRQIIRREGEYWTLVFAGEICRLKDVAGLRYLAYLVLRPHERLAALEVANQQPLETDVAIDDLVQERARVNVTRALAAALRKIEPYHPALVLHLRATLRTGRHCTYSPDPRVSKTWQVDYQ